MNYENIIDDILEIDEKFTLIRGHGDIVYHTIKIGSYTENFFKFKDLKSDDFWTIIGRHDDKYVLESLNDEEFDVDREGEYEFIILLKYNPSEFESGSMITPGYLEIVDKRLTFIQTFEQREREQKLNEIFLDEFDNLFKYNDESIN